MATDPMMRAERNWRERTERTSPPRWSGLERPHQVVQSFETFAQTCWEVYDALPSSGQALSYEQFRRQLEAAFNATLAGPYPYSAPLAALAIDLANGRRVRGASDDDDMDLTRKCMDMGRIARTLQLWGAHGGQYLASPSVYVSLVAYVRAAVAAQKGAGRN